MLCGLFLLAACASDEGTLQPSSTRTCKLRLELGRSDFGTDTRAGTQWEDKARVYLQFTVGTARVATWADYHADADEWEIDADAAARLTSQTAATCEIYYFAFAESPSTQRVGIGTGTIIYADDAASCTIYDETDERFIVVSGSLAPLTCRLRLVGTPNREYSLSGLMRYTAYHVTANSFTANTNVLTGTIGSSGSSEYLYVLPEDADNLRLTLAAEGVAVYVRTAFTGTELQAGASGYLTLPTLENMGRWQLVNKNNGREISLPILSTVTATANSYAVRLQATVTNLGNGSILEAGFLLSESETMTNPRTISCGTSSTLSQEVTGLKAVQTYYVRCYARNERGITYGDILSFETPEKEAVGLEDFGDDESWDDGSGDNPSGQSTVTQEDYGDDESWDETNGEGPSVQNDVTQEDYGDDEQWDDGSDDKSTGQNSVTQEDYADDEDWN